METDNTTNRPHAVKRHTKTAEEALGFSLAPEEIDEIAEHLQGCPPCLEFIESLKTTVQLCKELGATEQPSPLDPDVRQQMLEAYQAMQRDKETAPPPAGT